MRVVKRHASRAEQRLEHRTWGKKGGRRAGGEREGGSARIAGSAKCLSTTKYNCEQRAVVLES